MQSGGSSITVYGAEFWDKSCHFNQGVTCAFVKLQAIHISTISQVTLVPCCRDWCGVPSSRRAEVWCLRPYASCALRTGRLASAEYCCSLDCCTHINTSTLQTSLTASLSAPPAEYSCGLPASKHVCYNAPIHVWEIELLLLQDRDHGTDSQQNCDNLTSPLGAKDAFVLLMVAASCDFLFYGTVHKCTYLLTISSLVHYSCIQWQTVP